HLDIDHRAAVLGLEAHASRVLDHGARLGAPRQEACGLLRRRDGVELELEPRRPGHGPAPARLLAPVVQALHAMHVRHEAREVLEVLPDRVDLLDRRLDVNGLLYVHGPAPRADARQPAQLEIAGRAPEQRQAAGRAREPREAAGAQAVEREQSAARTGERALRRRPAGLAESTALEAAARRVSLQARNVPRIVV